MCMWDYRTFQTSGDGTAFGGHLSVVTLALQITVRGSYISNFNLHQFTTEQFLTLDPFTNLTFPNNTVLTDN